VTDLIDRLFFRPVQFSRWIYCVFLQKIANLIATVEEVIITDVLLIGMLLVSSSAELGLRDRSSSTPYLAPIWAPHKRMSFKTELRQELLRTTQQFIDLVL